MMRRSQPLRPHAFTLIELMISIALVLVLMIGINKVFKLTTDTVGAGQTLSAAVRDSRAAQAIYTQDLSAVAEDAPFMALRSMTTLAFRNRADEMGDRDYSSAGTVAQQQAA